MTSVVWPVIIMMAVTFVLSIIVVAAVILEANNL
jgi:hypothetical protein